MERIKIPKIYHPFIQGPYGERASALSAETGARIHIPPASTQSDEIVIAGEKNGVLAAKAQIEQIYEEMVKNVNIPYILINLLFTLKISIYFLLINVIICLLKGQKMFNCSC